MSRSASLTLSDPGRTYTYQANGTSLTQTRSIDFNVYSPDTPGTYPVVFWSHGHLGGADTSLARGWADAGYIVIMPIHLDSALNPQQGGLTQDRFPLDDPQWSAQRVQDMVFAFNAAAQLVQALGGGYSGDVTEATIAGHSQGAFTAALLVGAESGNAAFARLADPRFKQAVLVSPQGATDPKAWHGFYLSSPTDHSWKNIVVPMLVITGTADNGTDGQTYLDRLEAFDNGPGLSRHAIVIAGASHVQLGGSDPEVRSEVLAAATTFSNAYARNQPSALASLLDLSGYAAANPLVRDIFERAGTLAGGASNGGGRLSGGSGADTLSGLSTDDQVFGNGGADSLLGGLGADTVFSGDGADTILEASGANYLRGDAGDDSVSGGTGFDDINGNMGNDTLRGNDGEDWVVGGRDNDLIFGDAAFDIVYGNMGNDTVDGGAGNDWVRGGQGDDSVQGGAGDDWVWGDRGNDTISGGAGADLFYSFAGAGIDRIADFSFAEGDRLKLEGAPSRSVSQVGADVVVDMGNGDQVILVGVTLASLGSGWIT